jgi:hypothetical protein
VVALFGRRRAWGLASIVYLKGNMKDPGEVRCTKGRLKKEGGSVKGPGHDAGPETSRCRLFIIAPPFRQVLHILVPLQHTQTKVLAGPLVRYFC